MEFDREQDPNLPPKSLLNPGDSMKLLVCQLRKASWEAKIRSSDHQTDKLKLDQQFALRQSSGPFLTTNLES